MGTINIRKIDDEAKQKLKVKAAQKGQSLESYVREALEALADEPVKKRPIPMNTMSGAFAFLKDHDWDAENTEEIEAWENSTLP